MAERAGIHRESHTAARPQAHSFDEAERALSNQVLQRLASEGHLPLLVAATGRGVGNHAMQTMLRKLASRGSVQRFNAGTDDARKPTTDAGHPAVVNLGLNNLGPYVFIPMKGTWAYKINAPGAPGKAVGVFLQQMLKDRDPGVEYEPEKMAAKAGPFNWKNPITNANFAFHPAGVQPAPKDKRVTRAKSAYLKTTVAYPAGKKPEHRAPGKILEAMKSHGGGNAPRPFVSITQEDALGAPASHNEARHVVGGADMPDAEAVAWRAAFGVLGGVAGATKAAYSSTASAFKSVPDANTDVGGVINGELTTNWKKYRVTLITQGGVTLKEARAGGQIVAYKSTKGAKWGAAEKPAYLGAGPGLKPLFYPDPRYDAWATAAPAPITAAEYALLKTQPLTTDVATTLNRVNVRFVSTSKPQAKGWVINSAYPTG